VPADIIITVTRFESPGGCETEEEPVGSVFLDALINDGKWKTFFL
jgi:nicotinamide mononucleotide (NMN) deamidase PncC